MIRKEVLKEVVEVQREGLEKRGSGLERELLEDLDLSLSNYALIISGIRRCGKSTLLQQLLEIAGEPVFYLNFDTPRLFDFKLEDSVLSDELIKETGSKVLFFDEFQIIEGWEMYVRQKLDENFRVVITGSNASLLSKELGTRLTGRHITQELFPFSFKEFVRFNDFEDNADSLKSYLDKGGFPEYLKTGRTETLKWLFEDILYRDIAVRNKIRDVQSLKHLLVFLVSNAGNLVSASKLAGVTGIKSKATVIEYFNHFEESYLVEFMPKFSYSYKSQLANPRKVYFIDNGLLNEVTSSFNRDEGRKLENMVFWEFRRLGKEIFYYNEHGKECDFVISRNNEVEKVVQVCFDLNHDNERREVSGLLDAMKFFDLEVGYILTFDQKDKIVSEGRKIHVVPAYEYFG